MADAAGKKWPGNQIPTFKNNLEAIRELKALVEELTPTCLIPHLNFGPEAIRKHIQDSLNERRRCIRKGHDYDNVSKSMHMHMATGIATCILLCILYISIYAYSY